jgi:hypothetical protein
MRNDGPAAYVEFYDDQIAHSDELGRRRLLAAVLLGAILIGLLSLLGSPPVVWGLVTILYALTYYGFVAVKDVLRLVNEALEDLSELGSFLVEPRSKSDVAEWATSHSQADESNVPEAIRDLCRNQADSGSLRVTANAAFTQPSSKLSRIYFLRTALVLGGLFGTVLFFAIALGGPGLVNGDITALLPELRGALASTLTGILGSLLLGHLGSEIDGLIERSIWETEAFLTGSIAPILQEVPQLEAVNEVQLWAQLLAEVRHLRNETTESYAKLANDAASYSVALQAVSDQLTNLPAIQVPPQLANFQDTIIEFRDGMRVLEGAVKSLVDGVGSVGLFFPAKTVELLELVKKDSQDFHRSEMDLLGDAKAAADMSTGASQSALQMMRAANSTVTQLGVTVASVRSTLGNQAKEISESKTIIKDVLELVQKVKADTESSNGIIADLAEAAASTTRSESDGVGATLLGIDSTGSPLSNQQDDEANSEIPTQAPFEYPYARQPKQMPPTSVPARDATLDDTMQELLTHLKSLTSVAPQIAEERDLLTRIEKRLQRFDSVVRWHQRAARAPLMRFILLQFGARETADRNA